MSDSNQKGNLLEHRWYPKIEHEVLNSFDERSPPLCPCNLPAASIYLLVKSRNGFNGRAFRKSWFRKMGGPAVYSFKIGRLI